MKMKKLLFSLVVMLMPVALSAQLLDTVVAFYEDFDGATVKMTSTALFGESSGNWRKDSSLCVSMPASYHTHLFAAPGNLVMWTQPIAVDRTYPYVYLQFDHICKINNFDISDIGYGLSEAIDNQGAIMWGPWHYLDFTQNSPFYHGHAEVISNGNISQNWYSEWEPTNNGAVPNNSWWKTELFDMTQFLVNETNDFFRIRFRTGHASGTGSGTEVCAGWYIDNLKVIYSNVELVPLEITITPTSFVNNNGANNSLVFDGVVNNFTGPFSVHATLTDNDGIDPSSVLFWYETNGGVADTVVNTISVSPSGNQEVTCEWTIPMQCYGTTITYHIYAKDVHGSAAYEERTFTLQTTQSLLVNDARMEEFVQMPVYPDRMVTGQTYPVKAVFRNKGNVEAGNSNHMTSATFGWSVNGVNKPTVSWTGDLCLDYTDIITLGNHVALRDSNYIRVWLISRNNVTPMDNRFDDTLCYDGYACDSALSGTYTLGGPAADFPTVDFMMERFHRCGLGGPVTINVNAGTYTGFDFYSQFPGLDSNNTLTIQAAPGVNRSAVIITNVGNESPVTFTEMAYVMIRNVTIRNTHVGRCVAFAGRASHDITIDNCDIQGVTSTSTPFYNSAGIGRTSGASVYASGSGDKNIRITNNVISGVNFGVYFTGINNTVYMEEDFVVNGNVINSTVTGISAIQSKRWTIDGNSITQMATEDDMNYAGVFVQHGADFQSISGNRIKMNERGGTGLSITTYYNSNDAESVLTVANNEIVNKATLTGQYNIKIQNDMQMNVFHNSCYVYSLINVPQSAPLYISGSYNSTKDINIYNNIFYNASISEENKNYAVYLNYSATSTGSLSNTVKLNNNEYYSVGNTLGWYVTSRNNFAEWQIAMASRGDDTTSVNLPLDFVSPTDSLALSRYDGLECMPVSDVTTDIRGTSRYNTITFMGCYTHDIPAADLSLKALTSPVQHNECPSDDYPVKLMVKNTGNASLDFAATPATIYYTIDTITGSVTVNSGVLAPLQGGEVTIIADLPAVINTVYNYVFSIRTNGDNNMLNDTLRGSFEIQSVSPFYEEVFSSNDLHPSWSFEQIAGTGNWMVETGVGTYPTISPNYGLGRLFFNSKVFANNTESRAIMPVSILQGAVTPILEYWFAHDNVSSNTEGVTVKISTDGGVTYTAVNSVNTAGVTSTLVKRYNSAYATPGWEKYMVDLEPYSNGSCVHIAFDAKSNARNNINIDRVVIRNFYNTDMAVNDIWALGVNPTQHEVSPVIYANISNDGRNTQINFQLMLEITGANTYRDTITVPSLATRSGMVVAFEGVHLDNPGDNLIRVFCAPDQNNDNNEHTWLMTTTSNEAGYANDSVVNGQHIAYSSMATGGTGTIAFVNRYNVVDTLIATHVKAFITNTANNSNIGRHFRFIVVDANGNVIESSDEMTVTAAMENQWVTGEIHNYSLTSTHAALYVGIEMLDGGSYLGVQEEAPLRDETYYILTNGTLTPSTVGRQMVNAVVESYMPYELALLSLVSPVSACDMGHENIVVRMTNNGIFDLPEGTPVYYSVNGSNPVAATINQTVGSHETVDFTFPLKYDFTNNMVNIDLSYAISVWIDMVEGDRVHINDALNVDVESYGKAPMPGVQSPVHANYHESATLYAGDTIDVNSAVQFWYTNTGFESWKLQYVGNPFVTPLVYFDTTYYVSIAPGEINERQVGNINTASSNNISQPFVYTSGFSRGKILYKADELDNATGKLAKIGLYVATPATGEQGVPMRLYVMNTDLNALSVSQVSTWDDEIANATLVYDGNCFFNTTGWHYFNLPELFEYAGGNLLILTETYCDGNNCALASGSAVYPTFNSSSVTGCVLYKSSNIPTFTGNYSTYGKRLNMKFQFVDAGCQSEKVPVQVIADNTPMYDVEPVELVDPVTNQCALLDTNIRVKVRNLMNNVIPANTVQVIATFYTNTISRTVSHIIDESFMPNEEKVVRFSTPVDLSAPTADVNYDYVIVTDLIGTPAFHGNDTLRGTLLSRKTAAMPVNVIVEGEYLHPYSVYSADLNSSISQWTYQGPTSGSSQTSNGSTPVLTTPVLYDTVVYFIQGTTPPGNGCLTRVTKYQINVATPLYDISTDNLVSPLSYQCGVSNANLKVSVTNTWPTANTIPANTFKLKANFTGTTTSAIEHTISQELASGSPNEVVFGNTITLGSATQNNVYNYTVYSEPVDADMYVYRGNDTIRGTLYVPATPATPVNMTATALYGGTTQITPPATVFNQYCFYDQPTGGQVLAQGTAFVTPAITANPTYFYYSGKIMDSQNFAADVVVGTGYMNNNYKPFDFTKNHSVGIVMYTKDDLGFNEGTIDTVFFYVCSVGNGNVPIKLYLKNDTQFGSASSDQDPSLTPAMMNVVYQNRWDNAISGAQLIADGNLDFDHTGWYAIVIPGGFHYTGENLLLLTEHHGRNTDLGYIAPVFQSSTVPTLNKRVISYATDNDFNPASAVTFAQATVRFNAKFSIDYSCESAGRGVITVNTVLPDVDLDVVAITSPVTPNNAYSSAENVTVQISNHGVNTASDYTLSYQLEGQSPVTVTNPVNIPSGNTLAYTFATPVDLSDVYFRTDFKVYVSCATDNNHENDTVTVVLRKNICESGSMSPVGPSIANVRFAGVDNVPLPAGWSPFNSADTVSYTDYTQTVVPAVLVKGQSYPFSITNAFAGNSGVKLYKYVFIDYDRNGEFDISEKVFDFTGVSFNDQHPEDATSEAVISIPVIAEEGITLMRVVASATANGASTGCGYYTQGETEDYAVIIRAPFNHDLGVTGYFQPAGVTCPDQSANIKVFVKNYGSDTEIFTAANPLVLTAEVSGTTPGIYQQVFSNGSIAPGETQVYAIPGVNLLAAGDYTVVTTLAHNGDEYDMNDSWETSFSIGNVSVETIPHLENFDEGIPVGQDLPFNNFWTVQSSSTAYSWVVQLAPAANCPNAGPANDHTTTNIMGQFAVAAGKSSQTSMAAYTTLTSNCLDLRHQNGRPIYMEYWEHIFGAPNAGGILLVQVGTGDNFVTVDTVVGPTQTSSTDPWKQRIVYFSEIDEVARVRFMTKNHIRLMDIAIDDVNFSEILPDIAIASDKGYDGVLYPYDFRDTAGMCMEYGDTIHPVVAIVNSGVVPVDSFDIKGSWRAGYDIVEYTEHWVAAVSNGITQSFMPGDTMYYTFTNSFIVPNTSSLTDFQVQLMLSMDNNPFNDYTIIHPCMSTDIDDYVQESALFLRQNAPNPADDKTRISFVVPRAGKALVEVFSVTGQKLYSEDVNAQFGENYIDVNTSAFATGIYIYTLRFEDEVLTKKMTIQR